MIAKSSRKSIKQLVLGLFFPVACIGCGTDDKFICSFCLEKIKIRNFNDSWEKLVSDENLDRIFIASWYEEKLISEMIQKGKYQGQKEFFKHLAKVLLKFWKSIKLEDYLGKDIAILPLPLHRRRYLERGYNQSEEICDYLAKELKLIQEKELLKRIKYTKHQTKLKAEEREQNIKNAFQVNPKINIFPKKILIIDDVVTTGASLNEAARVLKLAGVEKVYALVIAKN